MADIKCLIGARILSEANDIKRTLPALAEEMGVDLEYINAICGGLCTDEDQQNFVFKMAAIYPVDPYNILMKADDSNWGVSIMRADETNSSARVFDRKNRDNQASPYYDYRDTAMSAHGPFRPEWIKMLRFVKDANPENPDVIYNNGHFLHQNTFFIGPVNFYYEVDGIKYCREMNTGDSNYITPFRPHSFTTRDENEDAIIIAMTYAGEVYNSLKELYLLGKEKVQQFCVDNRDNNASIAKLVTQYLYDEGLTQDQFAKLYDFDISPLLSPKIDKPRHLLERFAELLGISVSDLTMPEYNTAEEVVIKKHDECRGYIYPNQENPCCFLKPLVKSKKMPEVKMFELEVIGELNNQSDAFTTTLHTYVYQYSGQEVIFSWEHDGEWRQEVLYQGDSVYIKPFVKYFFKKTNNNLSHAKLCMVRVPGCLTKRIQKELSMFSSHERIVESTCWFN